MSNKQEATWGPGTGPEQITTAAELDALPVGSVVLDRSGIAWQKVSSEAGPRWADATGNPGRISTSLLVSKYGPVTVLGPVAEAEARGAREALLSAARAGWDEVDGGKTPLIAPAVADWLYQRAEQTGGDRG